MSYRLRQNLTITVGAENLFNVYPDQVNAAGLRAGGLDGNPAVEICPAFSAIGIDGGYYFAKARYPF